MDESTAQSRPPDSLRQACPVGAPPDSRVAPACPPAAGDAQVATNITPTTTAPLDIGTDVNTVGTTTQITGGTRPGNGTNLFHSFDSFTLGTGDVAHFMNDMQRPTTNIVGRVIGGEVSEIDGTLRTNNPLNTADPMNFGAANLWLVNPSGLLLGANARIEVGGSVSMSTANYLRFEGTAALFDMLSSPASLGPLSVAPVAAFGFVGSNPGALTVQGSQFSVTEGQSISLVGGTISIESGTAEGGSVQPVRLSAPNGKIQLASAASSGEFDAATLQPLPNADGASFTSFGSVSLAPGSTINVSGTSTVSIKGGKIVVSVNDAVLTTLTTSQTPGLPETISLNPGSSIVTSNSGTDQGADIQLIASHVEMDEASMSSTTTGAGPGGDITASVGTLSLTNSALIITGTSGPGRGGDVHITADSLTLESTSRITTATSGLGLVGGDLFLNVGTLGLLSGSRIRSTNTAGTDLDGDGVADVTGVGGNVTVQGTTQGAESAAEKVELTGGSRIESETRLQSGDGGRVSIRTTSLDLDEASRISSSTSVTGTDLNGDGVVDTGRGGDIVVAVQRLRVVGSAAITSNTSSPDQGAAAGGTVTVQGLEGPGSKAGSVVLSGQDNTGITSDSISGVPGDLTVHAGTLTVTNGAVISAGSSQSTGPAGKVTVTADSVVISAEGQIFSRSFAQNSGQVTITANALTLDNGSIETSTSSETGGRGGDVVLHGGNVSLTNGASINSQSGSEEAPFSTGRAGDITITGESLTLANHAEITSSSKGIVADAGDAGNITIQSGSTVVMNDSSMTTEAEKASGGQIVINAPEMVRLTNSQISTSVKGVTGESNGGNITIDPQFVILQNSQIIAQANAGAGGAITVTAGVFLADPSSVVSASSQQGPQGTVNIQSPVQNLGEQLTPLSQQFSSAAALLAQRCAARVADGKFSTFVVAGREGLPAEPGGFLASPSWTAELLGSNLSGLYPHRPIAAVAGSFPEYDARPIQLAKFGDACRQ